MSRFWHPVHRVPPVFGFWSNAPVVSRTISNKHQGSSRLRTSSQQTRRVDRPERSRLSVHTTARRLVPLATAVADQCAVGLGAHVSRERLWLHSSHGVIADGLGEADGVGGAAGWGRGLRHEVDGKGRAGPSATLSTFVKISN